MKLSEAWELYLSDKRLLGYSKHTLKGYSIQSRLLIRALGDIEISEATFMLLKGYLAARPTLSHPALATG